jgi:DUF4097 and DUF4098 domain-containing protein YvlB
MNTNHTFTALLVAASLSVAAPAAAQSDPCRDLPQRKALEQLDKQLGSLRALPDLRGLDRELSRLGPELDRELSQLRTELGQLRELRELGRLGDLGEFAGLTSGLESMTLHLGPNAHLRGPGQAPRHAGQGGPQETERFTKTFRVGRNGSLDLTNISGDIVVKAGTSDDVVIDAVKRTPKGANAPKNLQAVTISATEQAGRVEVRTVYPETTRDLHVSVDFTVTVPASTSVFIHSISGDIQATGTKGSLRLTTVSGDVRVEAADQIEELKSISGDVTVTGGSGTDVRATTVNGDITLRNVKAHSLDAGSISGDTTLTDVAVDRAAVKTISGDIDYTGPFARSGRYEFKAHSGDVRITPASATGFEVNASTFSGGIRCDVPMTSKTGDLPERQMRRELKGTVGDGSALVTVTTFSGDVTIGKKDTTGGKK